MTPASFAAALELASRLRWRAVELHGEQEPYPPFFAGRPRRSTYRVQWSRFDDPPPDTSTPVPRPVRTPWAWEEEHDALGISGMRIEPSRPESRRTRDGVEFYTGGKR